MRVIDEQQFQQARQFLQSHARVLDWNLAEYYFWGGRNSGVREALQSFQNADGGFGNSIEPDFRLQQSSPLATTIALQYACEIHLSSGDVMIQDAVGYLLTTFDPIQHRWPAVPEEVNNVPHAPWWTFDPNTWRCGVEGTWANPNAEIVGYLWRYKDLVPQSFLRSVTDLALGEFEKLPEKIGLHDFLCYQRLAESLPDPYKPVVIDKLIKSAPLVVDANPEQWAQYGAKPLQIAPSPESPFAPVLAESLAANLDYEIEQMNDDGSWRPNWSWFGNYDEDWKCAETEWKGHLTVRNLKALYDFGRIPSALGATS